MSVFQTIATVTVFDYEYDGQGKPMVGALIRVRLPLAATSAAPITNIRETELVATTDVNGYWSLPLVPNANLVPATDYWMVSSPTKGAYQINVPSGPGPYQSSAIAVTPVSVPFAVGFTSGSVVFAGASGALAQDNPNFFWDATNHRLGIGKTTPAQALDVVGSIAASVLTIGSILFASTNGLISQDNTKFFWDDTNFRLGIGTGAPVFPLHVISPVSAVGNTAIFDSLDTGNPNNAVVLVRRNGVNYWYITESGHIASVSPTPTLGALQTGISSQSITGTDTRPTLTLTTTGTPPGVGAAIAIVNYAAAYGLSPNPVWSWQNATISNPTVGNNQASTSTLQTPVALGAATTYLLGAVILA